MGLSIFLNILNIWDIIVNGYKFVFVMLCIELSSFQNSKLNLKLFFIYECHAADSRNYFPALCDLQQCLAQKLQFCVTMMNLVSPMLFSTLNFTLFRLFLFIAVYF